MNMKRTIGMVMAMTVCSAFAADISLVNAGFEDVKDGRPIGWKMPKSNWRVARGEGHNGNSGLVWESSEPLKKRAICTQRVKAEAGKRYVVSAMIRTENFNCSRGAKVCLQFVDASGKGLRGGVYPRGVKARTCDWCKCDGLTTAPDGTAAAIISLAVLPGASGKVVFDDVRLESADRPPVLYVFSSAYRDVAKDGKVTFNAYLNLPNGASNAKVEFVYQNAAGETCRKSAPIRLDNNERYASATIDVADLKMGAQDVRCVVTGVDGKELGGASFKFSRVAELPKRRVEIDAQGRCRVNGKPFFPIGMYSGKLDEKTAAIYATGPFNAIVVYGISKPEDLKVLEKHGIMYLATLKNEIPGKSHAIQRGIRTQAESDAFFREQIALLKDCPNLLGWYVCDEAPLSELAARRHLYDIYRAEDADHPCWAVMDKLDGLREWMSICDVIGADPYPVPTRPMSQLADFCRAENAATCGARAFWNVPQNFNWGWYGGRPGFKKEDIPFPTDTQLKFFNWMHIAAGANGLLGYTFSPFYMEKYAKYDAFARHWKSVCDAYVDVKRLTDVLLADPFAVTGGAFDTPVRAWQKDGKVYVLACNAKAEAANVTVRLGGSGWCIAAVELGDAASVCAEKDGIVFSLPTCGFTMVKMERSKK